MSSGCCPMPITSNVRLPCPECGQRCFAVRWKTMLHQVCFPENKAIPEGEYCFCANGNCTVGYFSQYSIVPKIKLRALQPGQPKMLCYCFGVSESAYRALLRDRSGEAVKAFVVEQTKERLCACELRNPSGRCCLIDFQKIEMAVV